MARAMLMDGKWLADWQPVQAKDEKGGFVRQTSSFRNWITPDGSPGPTGEGGFAAEARRYHLYVALICPWASRTLLARRLKGLDQVVSVSVVAPELTEQGWRFGDGTDADRDTVNGATWLHEIYTRTDPRFTGRATVPVLWDRKRCTIVNNKSADKRGYYSMKALNPTGIVPVGPELAGIVAVAERGDER